jgi:hypothetical protein
MNDIDCLIAGFVGGFIAAGCVLVTYYQWIGIKSRQYLSAKRAMRDTFAITGLEHDMRDVMKQLEALNLEFYKLYETSGAKVNKSS